MNFFEVNALITYCTMIMTKCECYGYVLLPVGPLSSDLYHIVFRLTQPLSEFELPDQSQCNVLFQLLRIMLERRGLDCQIQNFLLLTKMTIFLK